MEGYQHESKTVQPINFKIHITANLTSSQIKDIITEAVERQMSAYKVTEVNFKVCDISDDHFNDCPIYGLSGCDVTLSPK